ncbi:MAG: class E sortase [Bifidobacteriaceae bacterium]|jgi:sortase A|nr:class E sortase [Bifidobacteriaceae bacterium]
MSDAANPPAAGAAPLPAIPDWPDGEPAAPGAGFGAAGAQAATTPERRLSQASAGIVPEMAGGQAAGATTRADLRREHEVQAAQATQAAQAVRAAQAAEAGEAAARRAQAAAGEPIAIPWPPVPVTKESDPRRRVPAGAIITGVLGELLITAGLLLGLYVVWEIVWSTVEARPHQVLAIETVHLRPDYVEPVTEGPYAEEYADSAPEIGRAAPGEPWLTLHVPRWGYGYDVAIAEGTDKADVLDRGLLGHYTETQGPGELGNFALAGHRITHGEPFAGIQQLRDGDELIVETDEYYLVYKMYDSDIVLPNDMSVIWPVPGQSGVEPARRIITLTTCHPRYTSTHRYIVWGEFEYWTKKADGPLRALVPPDERE